MTGDPYYEKRIADLEGTIKGKEMFAELQAKRITQLECDIEELKDQFRQTLKDLQEAKAKLKGESDD